MIGKGSVSHNSRKFNAKNTDPERTPLNTNYCCERIQDVYHALFDEALKRYNDKQTRADRRIDNYYEKIRRGKQEKPFHEVIFQIGNRDDTGVESDSGKIAAKALDEFYKGFAERNPNLRVFSAHLHMDESTPHLHIDFVPFTTGSKRGLDTRVSLKQALAAQGFKGDGKHDNEWNRWVQSEKEELAKVMEKYGILWAQKGTHYEHLSDYEFKRQQRALEVEQLTGKVEQLEESVQDKLSEYENLDKRIQSLEKGIGNIYELKRDLNTSPEYELPEPQGIITAKNYKAKFADPLVKKLKKLVISVMAKYITARDEIQRLTKAHENLSRENSRLTWDNEKLKKQNARFREENELLREDAKDHILLRKVFGEEEMQCMLVEARRIQAEKRVRHEKENER
ncbi:MAG: plasmid recombination protein [Eubacteriales bacterium]|nr:plasmid recombination protein [Eubacteriales bacterium]